MITTTLNCATGTLAPYVPSGDAPWNKQRVIHLFRRMGFSASLAEIEAALSQNPSTLIDNIIDNAISLPPSPAPEWADWSISDYTDFAQQQPEQIIEQILSWIKNMMNDGFREKMTLFWHNHFVTQFEVYTCPSWMFDYYRILQENALGNFRDFTHTIGTSPAMLVFLNGVQSTVLDPNENYARELYELFTLGQDNGYTQNDIVETARALTGWNGFLELCGPIGYLPIAHDDGEKTIFGQTGNWGYDDVHDILFTERTEEIAGFICGKLYRAFIHPQEDEVIVNGLAQTFLDNNFDIVPVLRQLFKSEHFFDAYNIGTIVRSPIEVFLNFLKEGSFPYNDEGLTIAGYLAADLGQTLYNPPDVAGWPGNRTWIDSNTLTGRWQGVDYFTYTLYQFNPNSLVQLAKDISGNSNDPDEVAQSIVDHFIPNGLNQAEAYELATTVFKWEVPQNYYDDGSWNLEWETIPIQMAFLLQHVARLPEFQLG
ncbi:MAG: DUF1800 domain-containing protein [Chitinophagales bacterium]|nr:DUF1800 domain-containing protein [Chitinophagales bacterium]